MTNATIFKIFHYNNPVVEFKIGRKWHEVFITGFKYSKVVVVISGYTKREGACYLAITVCKEIFDEVFLKEIIFKMFEDRIRRIKQ